MRLVFHGGAREVGRSCVEITTGTKRLLLDCGLKLTPHGTEYPIGFDKVDDIDAVFISHAHLDHTGALPLLDHRGMDCPIFMTKASKQLTRLLLKDAFKIGRINHQHLGYAAADIRKVLSCIRRVVMDTKGGFNGIKFKYFDAGHIPGSAAIFLDVEGTTLLYTGDINTIDTKLHKAAETDFPEIDIMICESTYGDRDHPPRDKTEQDFLQTIQDTIERGGSVIIPVFALGRSQEILQLLSTRKFKVPVYFDGMSVEATNITLDNPDAIADPNALKAALKKVRLVKGNGDRMEAVKTQAIIVTTSGMLTGGPVMHYLKYFHKNPDNAVLLTGYQGEHTNGRLLLEKKQVYIDGWRTGVKCRIEQFNFSAHAGMSQLKSLVRKVKPKRIFFMHGEYTGLANMQEWAEALGMDAHVPRLGESIAIKKR
ncbi:MBL fold metallo-hydrolase [Candidatus Woesearchaeota archaeon]|jgi:putative mRNA 3-end processing factor|nr:MBL fold metallo-hydrolase [Candidatus Woesearchaeota archaeon]